MEENLISVIIPIYKRKSDMLERAIKSIKNQTYSNYEIIVVDDNDYNDEYYKNIKEFEEKNKDDSKMRFIYNNKNSGANVARNNGIKNSKGEFIAFLDSDDEWKNNYLEKMLNKITERENIGACYAGYLSIQKDKNVEVNCNGIEGNIFYKQIVLDRVSSTSCVMIRKSCLEKSGLFDEALPARQDYDMWIRISRYYEIATVREQLVNIYSDGHESISTNYTRRLNGTKMVYEKIEKMLNDEELQKYYNSIQWGKLKTFGDIYIDAKMYEEAYNNFKRSLKYKFDLKILIKAICLKFNIYDKVMDYRDERKGIKLKNV